MLERWQFVFLLILALLCAGLMAGNMVRFNANRSLQAEVNQRAQFVQQSAQLENLTREIATALAQLGVRSQDAQIQALLGRMGITVNVTAPESPTKAASVQPAAEGKRK